MKTKCPYCGTRFNVEECQADSEARCSSCEKHFKIIPVDEHGQFLAKCQPELRKIDEPTSPPETASPQSRSSGETDHTVEPEIPQSDTIQLLGAIRDELRTLNATNNSLTIGASLLFSILATVASFASLLAFNYAGGLTAIVVSTWWLFWSVDKANY